MNFHECRKLRIRYFRIFAKFSKQPLPEHLQAVVSVDNGRYMYWHCLLGCLLCFSFPCCFVCFVLFCLNICGFACQQRVLKTFLGPGYLRSENEVVWLWHSLVNLHICICCILFYWYFLLFVWWPMMMSDFAGVHKNRSLQQQLVRHR